LDVIISPLENLFNYIFIWYDEFTKKLNQINDNLSNEFNSIYEDQLLKNVIEIKKIKNI
jgi:hypothetical protein